MVTKKQMSLWDYKQTTEPNIEEVQKFLSQLSQGLDTISSLLPNVVDTEIKPFGNSGHIVLPKEYVGKKATVIIKK